MEHPGPKGSSGSTRPKIYLSKGYNCTHIILPMNCSTIGTSLPMLAHCPVCISQQLLTQQLLTVLSSCQLLGCSHELTEQAPSKGPT